MLVSKPEHPLPEAALLAETAWLKRLARRMIGEEDADDVVQDACAAALASGPRDPSRLRGWLASVVRNAARQRYRDRMRRLRREAAAARGEAAPEGDDVVIRAETQQRVVSAVLALDEPYRTTVLLRFFDDLPPRKVAERMGVPVATVHTRLRRGLDQLRARLDERGRSWALVLLPLLARRGRLGSLLAAGGAVMSKKAAILGAAAILALSVGGVLRLSRAPAPDRARELALAPRAGGGEEAPEPGGGPTAPVEGAVRLRGRVVDAEGNGIAGARVDVMPGVTARCPDGPRPVHLVRRAWERVSNPPAARATAQCDEEGRFDLGADTSRGDCLVVRARGYFVEIERDLSLVRSTTGIELRLRRRSLLRVRVTDEDGAAVPGARATLLGGLAAAELVTDAEGRVDFGDAPGTAVLVEHEGHLPAMGWMQHEKEEEVEIRLREPSVIEGTVLRARDRSPVAGAELCLDGAVPCFAKTDAKGAFRLEVAELNSWSPLVVDGGAEGSAAVPMAKLPPGPLEIVLHPTVDLEGRLVGAPAPEGLRVYAVQPGLPWREARADAKGAFRIEHAAADVAVQLAFDPWSPLYEEKDAPGKPGPWTGYALIEVVPKGSIEGTVVDETGEPVPGARVGLGEYRCRPLDGVGLVETCAGDVFTDDQGRFRLESFLTARHFRSTTPGMTVMPPMLRVSAPGFAWKSEGPFLLEPGEERKGVLIRLDRGLSITGRVVMEDGSPVPRVWVRAGERDVQSDLDRHSGSTYTDANGRYRFGGLTPGAYYVGVWDNEFLPTFHDRVPAGSEAPLLVLRRAVTIEGIVVDESGQPLRGASVSAWCAGANRNSSDDSNREGRFRIRQLEPGSYSVSAGLAGYLWERRTGIAAPSSGVRFVLRRGLSITGRIVRPDGTALPLVAVRAERIRWDPNLPGFGGQGDTDDEGRFEINGLSDGEFRLTFDERVADENVLPPLMGIAAGADILVRAEAGRFIEGAVLDRDGNPVQVRVEAVPLDPDGYAADQGYTKEDGHFRVGPLKGTRFTLIAGGWLSSSGFALDVEAGATDVKIVTGRGEVLAGRVVDKDGNATAANLAIIHGTLGYTWQSFTEDGRFRVEGLPSGTYFLTATSRTGGIVYETWRDTRHRGPPGTKVESGTLDVVLTVK